VARVLILINLEIFAVSSMEEMMQSQVKLHVEVKD
jgi:hypothetical protein